MTYEDYVIRLDQALEAIVQASQRHQSEILAKNFKKFPAHSDHFEPGEYVCVSYPSRPPHKLSPRWRGPMIVVSRNKNLYDCHDVISHTILQFDFDRLKRYYVRGDADPVWVASADKDEFIVDKIVDHVGNPKHKSLYSFEYTGRAMKTPRTSGYLGRRSMSFLLSTYT